MSSVKIKAENRDKKKQQKMRVSGKRVFQLQAVILKKAKIKK